MNAVAILAPTVGIAAACHVLDVPRAFYYRQHPLLGPAAADGALWTAEKVRDLRQSVLDNAYIAHPERFVHSAPEALELPTQVWINEPTRSDENTR